MPMIVSPYDFRPGQSRRLWRAQGRQLTPRGADLNLSLGPTRPLLTLAQFQILVIEKAIVFQLEFLIATRAALNAKKPGAEAGPERCVGGGAFLPDARHSNHGIAEGPVASR